MDRRAFLKRVGVGGAASSLSGSTLNSDGTVIREPTSNPLKHYPVKVKGEAILLKVSQELTLRILRLDRILWG